LNSASPLPLSEFVQRRDNLAKALVEDGVDAFVVEPGYTFQYYANVSQPDWVSHNYIPNFCRIIPKPPVSSYILLCCICFWKILGTRIANSKHQEVWEPEERPFLMIIQPSLSPSTGEITARTSFLVPHFEVERAKLLGMPFTDELIFIPWEEHWNPYSALLSSWSYPPSHSPSPNSKPPKIMIDDEMRDFIQRGLSSTGFKVVGLGGEVEKVKQIKTKREIGILRAVNTGTVEAVRAMRGCMYPGLREVEVAGVLDETLRAGGLEPFFDIVLFGMSSPSTLSITHLPPFHPILSRCYRGLANETQKMKMRRIPTAAQTGVKSSRPKPSFSSTSGTLSSLSPPSLPSSTSPFPDTHKFKHQNY
jgi:hypothetical protein